MKNAALKEYLNSVIRKLEKEGKTVEETKKILDEIDKLMAELETQLPKQTKMVQGVIIQRRKEDLSDLDLILTLKELIGILEEH